MNIVCLDMEGVLVPEIWIAFAEASGIPELKRTTRDEPDYDKLMKWRLGILKEHGLGLKEIQETIAKIDPLPGAKEFLDYCKKAGTKMCLASATDAQLLKIALKHCDIEDYFLKVFSCGDIGKGKDEPDIFLLAQEFLGESVEDTFVFEDSLTAIETAVKLGMPTVAIYDRYNYGQERMKEIATEYIAQNQTLARLIED